MVTSVGAVNESIGRRAIEQAWLSQVVNGLRGDPLGSLVNLHDQFLETALDQTTDDFDRDLLTELAPYLGMPTPQDVLRALAPLIESGYAATELDLARADPELGIIGKLFDGNRQAAARYERLLRQDPLTREMFELMIGGRIVEFGDLDGRFAVEPYGESEGGRLEAGAAADPGELIGSYMRTMRRAGNVLPFDRRKDPFTSMLLAGLASAAGLHPAGEGWQWSDNTSPLGGRGLASRSHLTRPGIINNTNEEYEAHHLDQCAEVLNDPSLTMEDKVTLFIMLIMEKMDKDIKRQAEYINSLQQQQGRRPGTIYGNHEGGMGPGGQPYGSVFWPQDGERAEGKAENGFWNDKRSNETESDEHGRVSSDKEQKDSTIEIETLKLKRIVDKRSQMFDMLRQIIDRYNQSAKSLIDTMGR